MPAPLPDQGVVFWPVGTGDSTTIVVREDQTVVQVDLHDQTLSESEIKDESSEDSNSFTPIVKRLKETLPKRNETPYLSVFILTHPDRDHILGFKKLLDEVEIDEIWHTPRIFREYEDDEDLCEDAKVFRDECDRRRRITIDRDGDVDAGDRVRVIGHDELFEDDEKYKDFPKRWRSFPGKPVTHLDGEDLQEHFEAFIHAPFKDGHDGDRNDASLALHVTLRHADDEGHELKGLFFGDLSYPTLKRIVEKTREQRNEAYLEWHFLLTPHHCSKCAMYRRENGDDTLETDPEICREFEEEQLSPAYVVASASPPFTDEDGTNPPHQKARHRYEEIVESGCFLCTHEHGEEDDPERIEFTLDSEGVHYRGPSAGAANEENSEDNSSGHSKKQLGDAAREGTRRETPLVHTGYGNA